MRDLVTEGCSYLVGNTNVLIYIIFDGKKMRFKHITMWIIKWRNNDCKVRWLCVTKNHQLSNHWNTCNCSKFKHSHENLWHDETKQKPSLKSVEIYTLIFLLKLQHSRQSAEYGKRTNISLQGLWHIGRTAEHDMGTPSIFASYFSCHRVNSVLP